MKNIKAPVPFLKIALATLVATSIAACTDSSQSTSPEVGAVTARNVSAGDSEALLSWDPIEGSSEYTIYYSTDTVLDRNTASKLNDSVGTITGTSAAVIDLDNDARYYFWVEAVSGPNAGVETALGSTTPSANVFGVVASDVSPQINALEVNPNSRLVIPFNSALDASSVNENTVTVTVNGEAVAISLSLVENGHAIEAMPNSGSWTQGTAYVVSLSSDIQTQAGESLSHSFDFLFNTLDSDHLVAWWDFDNSLLDTSAHSNVIDTNQGVTFSNEDDFHKSGTHSAYFNGSSYLKLSDSNFDLGDQFTVATWIKIPTVGFNINTIMSNTLSPDESNGFKIGINSWETTDKNIIMEMGDGTSGGKIKTGPGVVQDGEWYHFAYNVDKENLLSNGQHVQIFFNGVEADVSYEVGASNVSSESIDWENINTHGPLYFGSFPVSGAYPAGRLFLDGGYLDDFRIYSRALSSEEIVNIAR